MNSLKRKEGKAPQPAVFLIKTFNMVSDPSTDDIISWNEKGDGFIVKKEHAFAEKVLPNSFRHNNFSSFVRQLNFYGFKKRSNQVQCSEFRHKYFRRGCFHLLHMIKRKSTEASSQVKDAVSQLQNQVVDLKRQYDELWKTQNQILYVLSRYLRAGGAREVRIPGRINRTRSTLDPVSVEPRKRPRLLLESGPPAIEQQPSSLSDKKSNSDGIDISEITSTNNSTLDDDTSTWQAIGDLQGLINQIPHGREYLNTDVALPMSVPKPSIDDDLDPSEVAEFVHNSATSRSGNSTRPLQLLLPAPPSPLRMGSDGTSGALMSPIAYSSFDSDLPSSSLHNALRAAPVGSGGSNSSLSTNGSSHTDTWYLPTNSTTATPPMTTSSSDFLDYSDPNLFANNFDTQSALEIGEGLGLNGSTHLQTTTYLPPFGLDDLVVPDPLLPPDQVPSPPNITVLPDGDTSDTLSTTTSSPIRPLKRGFPSTSTTMPSSKRLGLDSYSSSLSTSSSGSPFPSLAPLPSAEPMISYKPSTQTSSTISSRVRASS